jgi:hypothetical protein
MESLEGERKDWETMEARLKADLSDEEGQQVVLQDQMATLNLFHSLVEKNACRPERIRMMIPRFVD